MGSEWHCGAEGVVHGRVSGTEGRGNGTEGRGGGGWTDIKYRYQRSAK